MKRVSRLPSCDAIPRWFPSRNKSDRHFAITSPRWFSSTTMKINARRPTSVSRSSTNGEDITIRRVSLPLPPALQRDELSSRGRRSTNWQAQWIPSHHSCSLSFRRKRPDHLCFAATGLQCLALLSAWMASKRQFIETRRWSEQHQTEADREHPGSVRPVPGGDHLASRLCRCWEVRSRRLSIGQWWTAANRQGTAGDLHQSNEERMETEVRRFSPRRKLIFHCVHRRSLLLCAWSGTEYDHFTGWAEPCTPTLTPRSLRFSPSLASREFSSGQSRLARLSRSGQRGDGQWHVESARVGSPRASRSSCRWVCRQSLDTQSHLPPSGHWCTARRKPSRSRTTTTTWCWSRRRSLRTA